MPQLARHAAEEYLEGFAVIGLRTSFLPNLEEISDRLQSRTRWKAVPVTGFIPGPAFFAMFANRQFPTATWLRSSIEQAPVHDIFDDVFGHVPMHAHHVFADFLADYGQLCASLSDEAQLQRIGRLFWQTVKFGLIRQHGRVKFYGSGLISSTSESTKVLEGRCEIRNFNLDEVLNTPVQVDQAQKVLFAIESFDQIYEALHLVSSRIASESI